MKKVLLVLFVFIFHFSFGQNLVLNGDFEQYTHCPGQLRQISLAPNWFYPSEVIPDYFNGCTTSSFTGVPKNNYGRQYAYSGSAYCGIVCYSQTVPDTRTYIEGTINSFLIKDSVYHFEMRVNLADGCKHNSDDFGVYFSDTAVTGYPYYYPLPFIPQISNLLGNTFDTAQWTLVQGDYTAKGGEKYFIIGNFKDDASSIINLYNKNGGNVNQYLYIDDVKLTGPTGALPKANFQSGKTDICAGTCINFSNNSKHASNYQWSFDGASPAISSDANPTNICYSTPGKYSVRLIAINGSLRDTQYLDKYIAVDTLPHHGIIYSSRDTICAETPLLLYVSGNSKNIQWQSSITNIYFSNFANGNKDSIIALPKVDTYYRVIASNTICSDTSPLFKIIVKRAPQAAYTFKVNNLRVAFNSDGSSGDVTDYHWDFGDDSTSIVPNPVYTFSRVDTFLVCLTVSNGSNCSYTICKNINVSIEEGIPTLPDKNQWSIYPNPADESITVTSGSTHQKASITIYNFVGQVLYSNEITSEQVIPTINLSNGIYFLTLESATGTEVKKIVVTH